MGEDAHLYTVSRERYEDALATSLPDDLGDDIAVDRRGYAEAVADELGEDYLGTDMLIFDPEQQDAAFSTDRYRFLDTLADQIYSDDTTRDVIERITGPVRLTTRVRLAPDGFVADAQPVSTAGYSEIEAAQQLLDRLESLDIDDLKDDKGCSSLTQQYKDITIPDVVQEDEMPDTWAEQAFSRLELEDDDEIQIGNDEVTVGQTRYATSSLSETTDAVTEDGWVLGRVGGVASGILSGPAYIENPHGPVNAIVTEPDQIQETPPTNEAIEALYPDYRRHRSFLTDRERQRLYDALQGEPSMGSIRSVHDEVNVLVLGDIRVDGGSGHGTVKEHGERPDDPSHTLHAYSVHDDVTVQYLDPDLHEPLEQAVEGQQRLDPGIGDKLEAYLHQLRP